MHVLVENITNCSLTSVSGAMVTHTSCMCLCQPAFSITAASTTHTLWPSEWAWEIFSSASCPFIFIGYSCLPVHPLGFYEGYQNLGGGKGRGPCLPRTPILPCCIPGLRLSWRSSMLLCGRRFEVYMYVRTKQFTWYGSLIYSLLCLWRSLVPTPFYWFHQIHQSHLHCTCYVHEWEIDLLNSF